MATKKAAKRRTRKRTSRARVGKGYGRGVPTYRKSDLLCADDLVKIFGTRKRRRKGVKKSAKATTKRVTRAATTRKAAPAKRAARKTAAKPALKPGQVVVTEKRLEKAIDQAQAGAYKAGVMDGKKAAKKELRGKVVTTKKEIEAALEIAQTGAYKGGLLDGAKSAPAAVATTAKRRRKKAASAPEQMAFDLSGGEPVRLKGTVRATRGRKIAVARKAASNPRVDKRRYWWIADLHAMGGTKKAHSLCFIGHGSQAEAENSARCLLKKYKGASVELSGPYKNQPTPHSVRR